jgi:hypothetical protein
MRHTIFLLITWLFTFSVQAGFIEKVYHFDLPVLHYKDGFHTPEIPGIRLSASPGQPVIPWKTTKLLLPPGEVCVGMEITREAPYTVPGKIILKPAQPVSPLSAPDTGHFLYDRTFYESLNPYPSDFRQPFSTQTLDGATFVFSAFTPFEYFPAEKKLIVYRAVTVRIITEKSAANPTQSFLDRNRNLISELADNPEQLSSYTPSDQPLTNYQYLIVAPLIFKYEFQSLVNLNTAKGISTRVVTLDSILMGYTGFDYPEKIRNFIKSQYLNHQIQYVLLSGNPALVPCRKLHCSVLSGGVYYDSIPADLYYAAMDGTFDLNNNRKYGEIADSADLLPELSVGRFPVNDTSELRKMIRKTIGYQVNPVLGEFAKPLLLGEHLYSNPMTFGGDYMDLLIDDHSDNGYFTHGIPSVQNTISTMYDTMISPPSNIYRWSAAQLLAKLNQGNSFIHHLGHANASYMLRLSTSSITNANFSQINGTTHNFQLLYTQGCDDGAFDLPCIAAKAVKIDNFLVAGIFNSRYGWFNQGTTDGPSQHLEREFVSAMYRDTLPEFHIGTAHQISKIKTAPYVGLPGEFEPGAQRWCHFGCNLLGDPALRVWTAEPEVFIDFTWTGAADNQWQNPANWNAGIVPGTVVNVTIPQTANQPVISTAGTSICRNLTLGTNANLTILPGKTLTILGTVILSP